MRLAHDLRPYGHARVDESPTQPRCLASGALYVGPVSNSGIISNQPLSRLALPLSAVAVLLRHYRYWIEPEVVSPSTSGRDSSTSSSLWNGAYVILCLLLHFVGVKVASVTLPAAPLRRSRGSGSVFSFKYFILYSSCHTSTLTVVVGIIELACGIVLPFSAVAPTIVTSLVIQLNSKTSHSRPPSARHPPLGRGGGEQLRQR